MRPKHYTGGELEPLKIIKQQNLPFELGNALKYIARCNHKGTKREDLEKAIDYLKLYIDYRNQYFPEKNNLMLEWDISVYLANAVIEILCGNIDFAEILIREELANE
jgi:hypothetical protein